MSDHLRPHQPVSLAAPPPPSNPFSTNRDAGDIEPVCTGDSLPDEVLLQILAHLDEDHLSVLRSTSRRWYGLCGETIARTYREMADAHALHILRFGNLRATREVRALIRSSSEDVDTGRVARRWLISQEDCGSDDRGIIPGPVDRPMVRGHHPGCGCSRLRPETHGAWLDPLRSLIVDSDLQLRMPRDGWDREPLTSLAYGGHLELLKWALENCVTRRPACEDVDRKEETCAQVSPDDCGEAGSLRDPADILREIEASLSEEGFGISSRRGLCTHAQWDRRNRDPREAKETRSNLLKAEARRLIDKIDRAAALEKRARGGVNAAQGPPLTDRDDDEGKDADEEGDRDGNGNGNGNGDGNGGEGGHTVPPIVSGSAGSRRDVKVSAGALFAAAARGGRLECIKWLREQGYMCEPSALCEAARAGHAHVVDWLIENGEFDYWCPNHGMVIVDAVGMAITGGHPDIALRCYRAGVFPSYSPMHGPVGGSYAAVGGSTVGYWLLLAAARGDIACARALIEGGVVPIVPHLARRFACACIVSPSVDYSRWMMATIFGEGRDRERERSGSGVRLDGEDAPPEIGRGRRDGGFPATALTQDGHDRGYIGNGCDGASRGDEADGDGGSEGGPTGRQGWVAPSDASDSPSGALACTQGGWEATARPFGLCARAGRRKDGGSGGGGLRSAASNVALQVGYLAHRAGWVETSKAFGTSLHLRQRMKVHWPSFDTVLPGVDPSPFVSIAELIDTACLVGACDIASKALEWAKANSTEAGLAAPVSWDGKAWVMSERHKRARRNCASYDTVSPDGGPYLFRAKEMVAKLSAVVSKIADSIRSTGRVSFVKGGTVSTDELVLRCARRVVCGMLDTLDALQAALAPPQGDEVLVSEPTLPENAESPGMQDGHWSRYSEADIDTMRFALEDAEDCGLGASEASGEYRFSGWDLGDAIGDVDLASDFSRDLGGTNGYGSDDGDGYGDGGGDGDGDDDGTYVSRRMPSFSVGRPSTLLATLLMQDDHIYAGPMDPQPRMRGVARPGEEEPRTEGGKEGEPGVSKEKGKEKEETGGPEAEIEGDGEKEHGGTEGKEHVKGKGKEKEKEEEKEKDGEREREREREEEKGKGKEKEEREQVALLKGEGRPAWDILPDAAAQGVFKHLPPDGRYALARSCKAWRGATARLRPLRSYRFSEGDESPRIPTLDSCVVATVERGDVRIMRWLLSEEGADLARVAPMEAKRGWLHSALELDRIDAAEVLRRAGCPLSPHALGSMAASCALSTLEWYVAEGGACSPAVCGSVASRGDLALLKRLRGGGCAGRATPFPWNGSVCEGALTWGRFDVFRWMWREGCPFPRDVVCIIASVCPPEMLKWALDNGCPIHPEAYTKAAGSFERLREEGGVDMEDPEGDIIRILDVLLDAERSRGVAVARSSRPCAIAAGLGRHRVIRWLMKHGFPIGPDACYMAARTGLYGTIAWLRQNGAPWDARTTAEAAAWGHRATLERAIQAGCPWDFSVFDMVKTAAAAVQRDVQRMVIQD